MSIYMFGFSGLVAMEKCLHLHLEFVFTSIFAIVLPFAPTKDRQRQYFQFANFLDDQNLLVGLSKTIFAGWMGL